MNLEGLSGYCASAVAIYVPAMLLYEIVVDKLKDAVGAL